jgi:hypothetical protein
VVSKSKNTRLFMQTIEVSSTGTDILRSQWFELNWCVRGEFYTRSIFSKFFQNFHFFPPVQFEVETPIFAHPNLTKSKSLPNLLSNLERNKKIYFFTLLIKVNTNLLPLFRG